MNINENIISEVVMVTMCLSIWLQNTLNGCYIGLSTCRITPQFLGRKSFQIFYEQEQATWSLAISQTLRQSPSVDACDGLDLKMVGRAGFIKAGRVGWIYKKKSVTTKWRSSKSRFCCERHRTAYSVISRFRWNLESSCGYILQNLASLLFLE